VGAAAIPIPPAESVCYAEPMIATATLIVLASSLALMLMVLSCD
jgi:hypothetical protein